MANKKDKKPKQIYEWIRAILEPDLDDESVHLHWEYQVKGLSRQGRTDHDEDVSGYTDEQVIQLTRDVLGATEKDKIELEWV